MASEDDLKSRVLYKAVRKYNPDGTPTNQCRPQTQEDAVAPITEKLGAFKFTNPLSTAAQEPKASEEKLSFKFNFAASINKTEELIGEKKFIVNKNLFQNPFINPFKAPPVPLSTQPYAQPEKDQPAAVDSGI